jgi:heptosyltransferase-2
MAAVLLGGAEDEERCRQIARLSGQEVPVAAGQLSLLPAAAVMEQCLAVVSNDSAAAHLAAAVNRPVVAIFGPTVPEFGFAPYGDKHVIIQADVDCRPCGIHGGRRCPRQHFRCMGEITPERVVQAVQTVLDRPKGAEV